MLELPELPLRADGEPWSLNVANAFQVMGDTYRHANDLLHRADDDPLRLRVHQETLMNETIPLLLALEASAEDEHVPIPWLQSCAERIGALVVTLRTAQLSAQGIDQSNITILEPVTITRTGRRGRPTKLVDLEYLQEAMSPRRRLTVTKLAELLGMHRNTLRYKLRFYNVDYKFTALTDADLDILVKTFRKDKPDSGIRYLVGYLRRHGLKIQKRRVTASIRRVDGLGRALRERVTIRRRKYKVSRPNALWHMDGHHKLILWGVVIHGMVDGYCRTVTGLRASNNNRALTVLDVFLEAIQTYGTPSRMRGDRGGENKDVSVFMILCRGPNRASFIWGSSTHNTRIERLWVEVGSQFARSWRAFFFRLERLHQLDRHNPHHLWLLHSLFLPMINNDCMAFQQEWNAHPISGEGHDRSPNDMRFIGMTKCGVYSDECEGVHPETIDQYYGVHGPQIIRQQGQTGAGHPADEEDGWRGIGEQVEDDVETHIHHDPVDVPEADYPFSNAEMEDAFQELFEIVKAQAFIPAGFGCRPDEWEETHYPSFEHIKSGRRAKELRVALPVHIWRPRAELWAQALEVMTRVEVEYERSHGGQ